MSVYLSPLGGAGWQFFDNNGNPLAGGLLYTYAAGTTTPQTTYTTAAGSVANANPIVLDSAGRVANQVWLTAGVSYKLELKTSTGTSLWTKDNIDGINDVAGGITFADITGSLPAARVSFTHTGSAFARTAQGKLDDTFSFQDFGALGDDSADDTAEMQAAIDYVASIGGGRLLGKPGSTYKISAALVLKIGVEIDLCGAIIKQYTNNIQIVTAPNAEVRDWSLSNGRLVYANKQDGTSTISVTVTGTLNAGDMFIDNTTGATGRVVSVVAGVLTYLAGVGTVGNGNQLFVNSQAQATTTSAPTMSKGGIGLRLANGAFSYNFKVDRLYIIDAYDGIVCPPTANSFAFVGQITDYLASVGRWAINYDCDSAIGANTNVIFQNCWHIHSQSPAAPFASGFFFNACAMFRWDSLLADKIEGQFVFAQTSSGEMGTLSLEASNLVAASNLQSAAVLLSDSSINIDTLKFVGNSFSTYVTMTVSGVAGTISAGQTITAAPSGARGRVVGLSGTRLTVIQDTINANFTAADALTTPTGSATVSGAPSNSGQIFLLRGSSATQFNQFSTNVSNFVTSGNVYAGQFIYEVSATANNASPAAGPFNVYNTQATLDRISTGVNITGTIRVGDTITGATSGASGVVTAVGTFLVQYKPSNPIPWIVGENVNVLGVSQGTSLGNNQVVAYLADFTTPPQVKTWNGVSRDVVPDALYVSSPGYLGLPQNARTANYTLVLTDAGKSIVHPITDNNARTFTIPANSAVPFPVGTEITFVNMINTLSIAITSDTMYLSSAGTTGTRTLAAFGVAKAIKVTSTSWIISGTGLT